MNLLICGGVETLLYKERVQSVGAVKICFRNFLKYEAETYNQLTKVFELSLLCLQKSSRKCFLTRNSGICE